MSPIESISLFPNPNAPDLGCFIRRKHGFETDPDVDFQNSHVDFNPSIDFSPPYHQTYFRISCGEAAFFERCLVYMTTDASIPPPVLQNFPPNFVLGGDFTPHPSDWNRFPTQAGERFYWFFGQFRNPASGGWHPDAAVGHSYDIYENGTLSTVQYDDTGGDRDFNDLIVEVAIVGRRSWLTLENAAEQVEVNKIIQEKGIPRLHALLKKRDRKA
ncbi:MAG TPA: hypothetical protein VHD76_03415 [Bryobacteraceae bacterium]|jgi:hypothetical protein|nr:hypothetical protein [Bryobacteraceae bacterium]